MGHRASYAIIEDGVDPKAMLNAIAKSFGASETPIQVNPHFLAPHRLEMPKEERMERFLAVVSEWKRRHPEHAT